MLGYPLKMKRNQIILASIDYWQYPRTVPKITTQVMEALIDEAHKHNLRAIVHSEIPQDAVNAAKAGADSIEHILAVGAGTEPIEMPDGLIDMLLSKGVYVVPCLTTVEILSENDPILPKRFNHARMLIKQLYDAGVNISLGTDAGAPAVYFGSALHREMEIMVGIGMSTTDTIVAATGKAADNLGKIEDLGTVEKGKKADLLVIDGNPLEAISDSRNIQLVMKNGKIMFDKLGLVQNGFN